MSILFFDKLTLVVTTVKIQGPGLHAGKYITSQGSTASWYTLVIPLKCIFSDSFHLQHRRGTIVSRLVYFTQVSIV